MEKKQPSHVAEGCSLITVTLPSWGGPVIEFFTHPGQRRQQLTEDRHKNMVLRTCLCV